MSDGADGHSTWSVTKIAARLQATVHEAGKIANAGAFDDLLMGQSLPDFVLEAKNQRHMQNVIPAIQLLDGNITIHLISRNIKNSGNNLLYRLNTFIASHIDLDPVAVQLRKTCVR